MAGALSPPAETSVGDEGNVLAKPEAYDRRGRGEHFLHPRSSLGTFIAYHHHIPGNDFAPQNRIGGIGFTFEHPCLAGPPEHLGGHGGLFNHRAVGGEVSVKDRYATFTVIRGSQTA